MATVAGEAAGYVSQQVVRKSRKRLSVIFLIGYGVAFATGLMVGFGRTLYSLLFIPAFAAVIIILDRLMERISKKLEIEKLDYLKGATGEARVAHILDGFPDDYRVFHDLPCTYGNIDHAVVGPSGVYIIETKNWKGVVASDGKGELLRNGAPAPKAPARSLYKTVMEVKDKIKAYSGFTPYVHGILVFPSAKVDANWGTTGHVNCMRDEQLFDYIVEKNKGKKLKKAEIEAISAAFHKLAEMIEGSARESA